MNNPEWISKLKKFEKPELYKSIIQIFTTIIPFLVLVTTMFFILNAGISYWLTLPISVITALFMVRIFIILHDCSHYSFFRSRKASTIVGYILGYLIFMPFAEFRRSHTIHHANVGKLDKRGIGDVWTLTVKEFLALSKSKQFFYNCFRNPLVFLIIGPLVQFFIFNRFPTKSSTKKEKLNIYILDSIILMSLVTSYFTIGLLNYIMVMGTIIFLAQDVGILLFFIQHQFKDVYWSQSRNWNPVEAALHGSSFYKLPYLLQWATGNIGLHHIHHLRPMIPNYKLNPCYKEIDELREIKPVKMIEGIRGLSYKLWDEENGTLIQLSKLKKPKNQEYPTNSESNSSVITS